MSLSWLPSAGWRLDSSLSLINGKLRTDAAGLGGKAGDRIPSNPKVSATLAATRNFEIAGNAAYAGVNARYIGERYAGFPGSATLPNFIMPAYTVLGLQAGIDFERFKLSAYVRNLANTRGIAAIAFSTLTAAKAVVTEPRTIGVAVNVPF